MEAAFLVIFGGGLVLLLVWLKNRFLAFRGQSSLDYEGLGPEFDLREHLTGDILCEGVIYGPTGRVTSRFVAEMRGTWDGDTCVLDEYFRYDSGATQSRCWRLTLFEDGKIEAAADDVVGIGEGQQSGPTVRMRYKLILPPDTGGLILNAVDWMYVLENGVIVNRSQFRKFGLVVAELVATMRRKDTTK